MPSVSLIHTPKHSDGYAWAADMIARYHYLGKMPDPRTSLEVFSVFLDRGGAVGVLVVGRPEATRCGAWYGSVNDVLDGRCEVTRWQVLNVARVWLLSDFQAGGKFCMPGIVPGFIDRRGVFRSTLAANVLAEAVQCVSADYLIRRPPCFLNEPYQVRWLLSYCNTALHRGTIYRAAGWELYRTNSAGIQTWRARVPGLTSEQDAQIRRASDVHPRSVSYRARRAQLEMI